MVVKCCQCRRIREDGTWLDETGADNLEASHTYCPECHAEVVKEIRSMRRPRGTGTEFGRSMRLSVGGADS